MHIMQKAQKPPMVSLQHPEVNILLPARQLLVGTNANPVPAIKVIGFGQKGFLPVLEPRDHRATPLLLRQVPEIAPYLFPTKLSLVLPNSAIPSKPGTQCVFYLLCLPVMLTQGDWG